jgi:hypothetical protein
VWVCTTPRGSGNRDNLKNAPPVGMAQVPRLPPRLQHGACIAQELHAFECREHSARVGRAPVAGRRSCAATAGRARSTAGLRKRRPDDASHGWRCSTRAPSPRRVRFLSKCWCGRRLTRLIRRHPRGHTPGTNGPKGVLARAARLSRWRDVSQERSHVPPRRSKPVHLAEVAWGTGGPRFKSGRPD